MHGDITKINGLGHEGYLTGMIWDTDARILYKTKQKTPRSWLQGRTRSKKGQMKQKGTEKYIEKGKEEQRVVSAKAKSCTWKLCLMSVTDNFQFWSIYG